MADSEQCIIAGIMEHIEEAGIHSGDSACVIPPYSLPDHIRQTIMHNTRALARELNVIGLMNIQFAVKDEKVYILEVNPRASRTVPFVSKATGIPWAKIPFKDKGLFPGFEFCAKRGKSELINLADKMVAEVVQSNSNAPTVFNPGPPMSVVEVIVPRDKISVGIEILRRPKHRVVGLYHVI